MARLHAGVALVVVALALGGCSEDGDGTVAPAAEEVEDAAVDARRAAVDGWDSLKNDAERLVNEIQSNKDPNAKQELLERCRDSVNKLREADSAQADRAQSLCDRIQNTDVDAGEAWQEIKEEIAQLNPFE